MLHLLRTWFLGGGGGGVLSIYDVVLLIYLQKLEQF